MNSKIVCTGSGKDVWNGRAWYPFKALLPDLHYFYCDACGKRELAELGGVYGRYTYVFRAHRAQGVTKKRWNECKT